jgi:hypothetical protein
MDELQAAKRSRTRERKTLACGTTLLGGEHKSPLTLVNPDPGKTGYEAIVGWEEQ